MEADELLAHASVLPHRLRLVRDANVRIRRGRDGAQHAALDGELRSCARLEAPHFRRRLLRAEHRDARASKALSVLLVGKDEQTTTDEQQKR